MEDMGMSRARTQGGKPQGSHPSGHNHHAEIHEQSAGHGHGADHGKSMGIGHGSGTGSMPGMDMSHTTGMGHMNHMVKFRQLFYIMIVLSIPVVACSHAFSMMLGYHLPDIAGVKWISPILGTVMYVWGGQPFLKGAVGEIRTRKPGMMLLIGMAITVAFLSSWGATLGILDSGLDFWWELALLIVIMLLGHWVEMRSLAQTSSAMDSLASLLPDTAERVDGHTFVQVSPADLHVGDVVIVRPGGRIPADGQVVQGSSAVDESMVTGESRLVTRAPGDHVVAGTVAADSAIRVEVTATGKDTALAGIQQLVADAQNSTSRVQRLVDKAAGWLFWYAFAAATLTFIVWLLLGHTSEAVTRAITVLVIACPHALGLAIPLVVSIASERAARAGVLIKDRMALENMRIVNTVCFDKTGTLTNGTPSVSALVSAESGQSVESVPSNESRKFTGSGQDGEHGLADHVLSLAAAAEAESEHPLAKAIVVEAQRKGLHVPQASEFHSRPGLGVKAQVDGHTIEVGGPALLEQEHASALPIADQWSKEGSTTLHVLSDGKVIGALTLSDSVRPESKDAVDALHVLSIATVMITGDAQSVAESVAKQLHIDQVFAGVRPEDKAKHIRELESDGHLVAMVGDGVNDAPALAQATVGIAIGAGTDVAIASAGVILVSDDPRSVLSVIELSRATYRKMKQNLWWAAGYNLIAVPLAAGVLAPIGFTLPMSVGAILMSLSTVIVALNAQMLRKLDLRPAVVTKEILGSSPINRQVPGN